MQQSANLTIHPIPAFNDNYIWLLGHPVNANCVVIDPGDAEPVLAKLAKDGLTLSAILITHHHWDHTGGIGELLKHHDVPVFGPKSDGIAELSHPLTEGDQIKVPGIDAEFEILDIPAHTSGHIAYHGHGLVFTGDTLFTAGCGRLFEGTAEQMFDSLSKLAQLPDDTQVYCGHEYTAANLRFAQAVEPDNTDISSRIENVSHLRLQNQPSVPSTLKLEKLTNPFLRCEHDSVKHAAEQYSDKQLKTPIEVFAVIRKWKDQYP